MTARSACLVLLLALLLAACPQRTPGPADDDDDDAGDDDDGGQDFEGDAAGECSDAADNDQDGYFDCDDQDCFGSPDCDGGDDDDATGDDDDDDDDDDDATTAFGAYIYAHTSAALYAVEPEPPYTATLVGSFTGLNPLWSQGITDIAVDQLGNMYAVGFFEIYSVDLDTAACDEIFTSTDILGPIMNSMTFLADGTLLVGGGSDWWIFDPDSGQRTHQGSFPGGWIFAGDMVGLPDGLLYNLMSDSGEEADPTSLVVLDMDTGDTEEVGPTGYGAMYGVAYYNSNQQIYGFTEGGEILLIDPATGDATVVDSGGPAWWGATTNPARWSD